MIKIALIFALLLLGGCIKNNEQLYTIKLSDNIYSNNTKYFLSSDGKMVAYSFREKDKIRLIINNTPKEEAYDDVLDPFVVFSPDDKHLAYTAYENCSYNSNIKTMLCNGFVVLDGKKQREFAEVGTPIFSPNSKRIAYTAVVWIPENHSFKGVVVLDNSSKIYDHTDITSPIFSKDSARIAYRVKFNDSFYLAIFDKEYGPYKIIRDFKFADDSNFLIYVVRENEYGKDYLFINEELLDNTYDYIWTDSLKMTHDKKYLTYNAIINNTIYFVAQPINQGQKDI